MASPVEGNKIYVGRLPSHVSVSDIEELFVQYGKVLSAEYKRQRGFAFVEMEDRLKAQEAIQALNNYNWEGSHIRVEFAAGFRDPKDRNICFKCSQPGHWARYCPEGPYLRRGRDSRSPIRRSSRDYRHYPSHSRSSDRHYSRSPSPYSRRRGSPSMIRHSPSPDRYRRSPPSYRRSSRSPDSNRYSSFSSSDRRRYSPSPDSYRYSRSPDPHRHSISPHHSRRYSSPERRRHSPPPSLPSNDRRRHSPPEKRRRSISPIDRRPRSPSLDRSIPPGTTQSDLKRRKLANDAL